MLSTIWPLSSLRRNDCRAKGHGSTKHWVYRHGWLQRSPSQHTRYDEALLEKIKNSERKAAVQRNYLASTFRARHS
ncbi:hypothetical protein RsS62_52560 [Rhizobium dioscoreae]|nr:hypothetical protein RsS62_52560 [Rhizobium dioscoreae]